MITNYDSIIIISPHYYWTHYYCCQRLYYYDWCCFYSVIIININVIIIIIITIVLSTVQVSLDWRCVPGRAPLLSKPCNLVCGCHVTLGRGQLPSTLGMPFSTGAMAGWNLLTTECVCLEQRSPRQARLPMFCGDCLKWCRGKTVGWCHRLRRWACVQLGRCHEGRAGSSISSSTISVLDWLRNMICSAMLTRLIQLPRHCWV